MIGISVRCGEIEEAMVFYAGEFARQSNLVFDHMTMNNYLYVQSKDALSPDVGQLFCLFPGGSLCR